MSTYSDYTDAKLLALLQGSDQRAFTTIFDRYHKLLYVHAFKKLSDEDEAMDIVQDVFIKLWEKRDEVTDINLAGYLFTVARNKILNAVKHEKIAANYVNFLRSYQVGSTDGTDHLIREKQLAAMIEAEIAALPPRMREIFELSRKANLSNKEIAARLHLSEHTVADQIKKSLRILRPKIGLWLILIDLLKG